MLIEIHTSDRMIFKRCRQRWEFSSNLKYNLEPRTPVPALWFGSAFHEALAAYYNPQTPRDPDLGYQALYDYIYGWLKSLGPDGQDPQREEFAKEYLDLGMGMLRNYFPYAMKNDNFDVVDVEVPFKVEIPGLPGVTYAGKLDGLIWLPSYKKFGILEHKTTMQFATSIEYLFMDDQVGSYLWACTERDIYPEYVLYNSIKKKAPMPLRPLVRGGYSVSRSQDTTLEVAVSTLKQAYGKVPHEYYPFLRYLRDEKGNNFVQRDLVRRNRREIAMLGTMLREEVIDMINNPSIYRSPSRINCTGCPFVAPCLAKWEGSDHEHMLREMYQERVA